MVPYLDMFGVLGNLGTATSVISCARPNDKHFTARVLQQKTIPIIDWLVVWTPLKNISQLGWLFPIYGKIKNVLNPQPVEVTTYPHVPICFHQWIHMFHGCIQLSCRVLAGWTCEIPLGFVWKRGMSSTWPRSWRKWWFALQFGLPKLQVVASWLIDHMKTGSGCQGDQGANLSCKQT